MFKTKFEKEYLKMKRESQWQQMEEENAELMEAVSRLKKDNMVLTNDLQCLEKRFKHLITSEFIRSFDWVTDSGQYVKSITDADRIVYEIENKPPRDGGMFERQRKLKEKANETHEDIFNAGDGIYYKLTRDGLKQIVNDPTEQTATECFISKTIENANVIKDCKTVIIKSRVMRACAVEAIKKEFAEVGINAIILPNDCEIDYIC